MIQHFNNCINHICKITLLNHLIKIKDKSYSGQSLYFNKNIKVNVVNSRNISNSFLNPPLAYHILRPFLKTSTIVFQQTQIIFSKRHYPGGRNFGHARNIVNNLSKPKPVNSLAETYNAVAPSNGVRHFGKGVNNSVPQTPNNNEKTSTQPYKPLVTQKDPVPLASKIPKHLQDPANLMNRNKEEMETYEHIKKTIIKADANKKIISGVNLVGESTGPIGLPVNDFEEVVPMVETPFVEMPVPTISFSPIPDKISPINADEVFTKIKTNDVIQKHTLTIKIQEKVALLFECGLLKYHEDEEKLTKEFHELLKKIPKNKSEIKMDFDTKVPFDVGLLQITDIKNTILLDGIHKHVIVIYTVYDNKKVVIGYLTSDTKAKITLSENQPFASEKQNSVKKYQKFALLHEPLIVLSDCYIKPLDSYIQEDGTEINQQKIGHDFVNNPKIKEVIYNEIKIIKNNVGIIYDGVGITENDIDNVLKQHAILCETLAQDFLREYMKLKKQFINKESLEKWFKNTKAVSDKKTFELLKQKIEHHENKN